MLKIGISACFFHPDPQRAVFKGKTLQYVEQEMAHWVMQKDAMALMIPSPEGDSRRPGSRVSVGDYARELDGLVLMGGSDVSPESYGEKPLKPSCMPGSTRCVPAVRWRIGIALCGPTWPCIAHSRRACWLSWLSGIIITWLHAVFMRVSLLYKGLTRPNLQQIGCWL